MAPVNRPLRSQHRPAQPRRRTSASSGQPKREGSWDFVERPERAERDERDAMEIDGGAGDGGEQLTDVLSSLQDVAERVGTEVELFAEKLDALKEGDVPIPSNASEGREKSIVERARRFHMLRLAKDYRDIAKETVDRLRRSHNADLEREIRRKCRKAAGHFDKPSEDGEPYHDPLSKTTYQDLKAWQAELATWELLVMEMECFGVIFGAESGEERAWIEAKCRADGRFAADGRSWIDFLIKHEAAQEYSLILQWLEDTAEVTGKDLELIQGELGDIRGNQSGTWDQSWLETRERLKAEKRERNMSGPLGDGAANAKLDLLERKGTQGTVTQLDPDAPTRQNRSLEAGDAQQEAIFWMNCWEMLRRGTPMQDVFEWCQEQNEYTKALSLGAQQTGDIASIRHQRIVARHCWRQACRTVASSTRLNDYQRAVFGLLGGAASPMRKVGRGWEGALYSRLNALILRQYEIFVLESVGPFLPSSARSVTVELEQGNASVRDIIESLQMDETSRLGPSQPFAIIQASMLAHDLHELLFEQGVALSRKARDGQLEPHGLVTDSVAGTILDSADIMCLTEDYQTLRVLAHSWMLWKTLLPEDAQLQGQRLEAVENVVAAYIGLLLLAGKLSLIPLYASTMSQVRGCSIMARALASVDSPREREDMIRLMRENDLLIEKIVLKQWQYAMEESLLTDVIGQKSIQISLIEQRVDHEKEFLLPRVKQPTAEPIAEHEEALIRSAEWFVSPEVHWSSAVNCMTKTANLFLRAGRIHAAAALYRRLPYEKLEQASTKEDDGDASEAGKAGTAQKVDSKQRKTRSKSGGHSRDKSKSVDITNSTDPNNLFEKFATNYLQLGQLVSAIEVLWEWRIVEDDILGSRVDESPSRPTSECIMKLQEAMEPLLDDPSFLTIPSKDLNAEDLEHIRHMYLPEIVTAYNSALHVAGHISGRQYFITSLDLTTQVAGNESLVSSFTSTGRLPGLVQDIAQTNAAMLRKVEDDASGKQSKRQKKQKTAKALGIWDIRS